MDAAQFTELMTKMDTIISNQEVLLTVVNPVGFAALAVIRYLILGVPLLIMVLFLWWFFKQFIQNY